MVVVFMGSNGFLLVVLMAVIQNNSSGLRGFKWFPNGGFNGCYMKYDCRNMIQGFKWFPNGDFNDYYMKQ